MSSMLQAPALPDDFKKVICDLISKVSTLETKVSNLEAENQDLRATLNDTQELLAKNCKKVSVIEHAIFDHDSKEELVLDEYNKPVLSHSLTVKPSEPEPETTPIIETIRDLKTCALVEYLKTEAKPNDFGQFVIGRKELDSFMKNIIEEGLRVKKVSRQLKADLFERAVKLFPDVVYIKKSPSGNKTKMLALKESAKRTITHGLTRNAPLGILI